jgi:hypothetical protein
LVWLEGQTKTKEGRPPKHHKDSRHDPLPSPITRGPRCLDQILHPEQKDKKKEKKLKTQKKRKKFLEHWDGKVPLQQKKGVFVSETKGEEVNNSRWEMESSIPWWKTLHWYGNC